VHYFVPIHMATFPPLLLQLCQHQDPWIGRKSKTT
jgi:hypothetical protein